MTDAMTCPLLDVRNLSILLGSRTVVHDVSLEIARGRTLALLGESGAGKSLTGAAIMGLLPPGMEPCRRSTTSGPCAACAAGGSP